PLLNPAECYSKGLLRSTLTDRLADEEDDEDGDHRRDRGQEQDETIVRDARGGGDRCQQDERDDRTGDRPRRVHAPVEAERLPAGLGGRGLGQERVPGGVPDAPPGTVLDPQPEALPTPLRQRNAHLTLRR